MKREMEIQKSNRDRMKVWDTVGGQRESRGPPASSSQPRYGATAHGPGAPRHRPAAPSAPNTAPSSPTAAPHSAAAAAAAAARVSLPVPAGRCGNQGSP